MSKAEEYRKLARECLDVAERMSIAQDRQLLLMMAQRWLELAKKGEAEEARSDAGEQGGPP